MFEQAYPDLGREIRSYLQKTHLTEGGYVNTPGADKRLVKYIPKLLFIPVPPSVEINVVNSYKPGRLFLKNYL